MKYSDSFYLRHPQLRRIAGLREPEKPAEHTLEAYKALLEKAERLCSEVIAPNAASVDAEGARLEDGEVIYAEKTRENIDACLKAGLWGLSMPQEAGGQNIPVSVFMMVSEIVSCADASFQNIWNLQSCIDIINKFGSEDQKRRYVPRVCSGEMMSMDLTEFEAGSDLQSVSLRADFDETAGIWRLNGVKRFITNGNADIHLVLARSEEGTTDARGLSLFIYDRRNGGMTIRRIENKLGLHGSPTCEIEFRNAPAELCGQRGMGLIKYVMSLMNAARLGVAAQSTGVSQNALEAASEYASRRRQFGTEIRNIPAVMELLAAMSARTQASRSVLCRTARYVDIAEALEAASRTRSLTDEEKTEHKKYRKLADALTPVAKGMASEYANRNAYDAVQIFGGNGYMMENTPQRIYRDARILSIYEGTTQMQVVASMKYIAGQTYQNLVEDLLNGIDGEPAERLRSLVEEYSQTRACMRKIEDQDALSYLGRRMYDAVSSLVMAASLLEDSSVAADEGKFLSRCAEAYISMTDSFVMSNFRSVRNFRLEDLDNARFFAGI